MLLERITLRNACTVQKYKGRRFIFHERNYFFPGFILCRRQQGRPVDQVRIPNFTVFQDVRTYFLDGLETWRFVI